MRLQYSGCLRQVFSNTDKPIRASIGLHTRQALRPALLMVVYLTFCLNAVGQIISNVKVTTKTDPDPNKLKFSLEISGKNFGADKGKIAVSVSPQGTLIGGPPTTDSVSNQGTVLNSGFFTAPSTYSISTVVVTVGGNSSDPFVMETQATGSGSLKKFVRIYRSILDPKTASDIFGKRVAQRFVIIQVTICNRNSDFQFLIHDLSLDLTPIMPDHQKYEASFQRTYRCFEVWRKKGRCWISEI